MTEKEDPRQLSFFSELDGHSSMPSISTMPKFDQALGNLIKMSDLGAFIQINILGLEKMYSLNMRELKIPPDFLNFPNNYSPITVHLFPADIRNRLKIITYKIKSFFNHGNSFATSFGYFLFRSHFEPWKKVLANHRQELIDTLTSSLDKGKYGQHYLHHLQEGYDHFHSLADITAPWEFRDHLLLKDIDAVRKLLVETGTTLHTLKPTEIDFPFIALVLKTNHIPTVLYQFLSQVQIHSVFKSIHLEYLSDREINTIEDIQNLTKDL